jgi:hypothetical protein
MKVLSTRVVISLLAVFSLGCSKKTEEAPAQAFEVVHAKVAEDEMAPAPAGDQPPPADVGEPEHVKLTPEQIRELVDPAEDTREMPTDHRLTLGIDGDPGWEQEELTPEELEQVRAAGAAVPQPTYAQPPSEPSPSKQPTEPSENEYVDEASSDDVYVGGTRAPVYRHRVREEAQDEAGADGPREPRPAARPQRRPRR